MHMFIFVKPIFASCSTI